MSLESEEPPNIVDSVEDDRPPVEPSRLTSLHELGASLDHPQGSDDEAESVEQEGEPEEDQMMGEDMEAEEEASSSPQAEHEIQPCELPPALSFSLHPSTNSHGGSNDKKEDWLVTHTKHFFILSSSGKPIYSYERGVRGNASSRRHKDEEEEGSEDGDDGLSSLMALIMALVSVVKSQGDELHHLSSGDTLIVIKLKGPLILVATSRGEGETVAAINRQIDLVYNQVVLVVSLGLEKMLQRNPSYDARPLLSGVDRILSNLITGIRSDPSYLFNSIQPFPLPSADRSLARQCLKEALKSSPLAYYTLLMVGRHVIGMEKGQGQPNLDPLDLWCLSNFIASNKSGREVEGETFCPVCLKSFNPESFLHAHISFIDTCSQSASCIYFVSLAGSASEETFKQLSSVRSHVELQLKGQGLIQRVAAAVSRGLSAAPSPPASDVSPIRVTRDEGMDGEGEGLDGELGLLLEDHPGPAAHLSIESLPLAIIGGRSGATPLLHFICRFPSSRQIVSSHPPKLFSSTSGRRELASAYSRVWSMVHDVLEPSRPNKVAWLSTERWSILALLESEIDLFIVLDPIADEIVAMKVAAALKAHLLEKRADLLLL